MKLTHDALLGSWTVAGSEIEHLQPGGEIYHFTPDCFTMEFPPSRQKYRHRYELTQNGFIYGEKKLRFPVTAWIEEGFLILRPEHGMETWSVRESAAAT